MIFKNLQIIFKILFLSERKKRKEFKWQPNLALEGDLLLARIELESFFPSLRDWHDITAILPNSIAPMYRVLKAGGIAVVVTGKALFIIFKPGNIYMLSTSLKFLLKKLNRRDLK